MWYCQQLKFFLLDPILILNKYQFKNILIIPNRFTDLQNIHFMIESWKLTWMLIQSDKNYLKTLMFIQ